MNIDKLTYNVWVMVDENGDLINDIMWTRKVAREELKKAKFGGYKNKIKKCKMNLTRY